MLIKLNGVPHPDLNGGEPQPVYIDASRVLLIVRSHVSHPKIGSIERHKEVYDRLYQGVAKITDKVNAYVPDMTDPVSVGWMKELRDMAAQVNEAYRAWGAGWRQDDHHPRTECTEVQLACGTALEHGVMLTRVWVSDTIEEVARLVRDA